MSINIIYGVVTQVFPAEGKAIVNFDDRDIASKKLPILYPRTFADKESDPMEEGEHVACIMDCNLEDGIIVGAIYSADEAPPTEADANSWVKKFSDGTIFKYDRTAHVYSVTNGTVIFKMDRTGGWKISKGSESLDLIINDILDGLSLITVIASSFGAPTSVPANAATFATIKARVTAFFSA